MLHRKQMPAARSRNIWVNRWRERSIRLSPMRNATHAGHGGGRAAAAGRRPRDRRRRADNKTSSISAFLRITEMLDLVILAQFRTENRFALFLELL
jgi:hypothetical protein